ncbi:conserved hypothetical protein [Burkholderiales bacterium 8X]|nr:conserved hypothetical protein [Burkholderiales bacterium 8X]
MKESFHGQYLSRLRRPATHRPIGQDQRAGALHEGQRQFPDVRLLGPGHPGLEGRRREHRFAQDGQRARGRRHPPGHQGIQQLAHDSPALRQG